ncbi:hypothetical protein [Streptomyces sp. NPDC087300]|uniref:hypothetical protein n=1 Tax=Streptomyces sp. NPDC087300 TaxID=3365780 RepID=UPI0037FC00A8
MTPPTPLLKSHSDTFPPAPPYDLDDPVAITSCDWGAFDELTEMGNHWSRPGWSAQTRAYYWLLAITDPLFVAQALYCQEALSHRDGFDCIAPDGYHLTLGRIGLTEEVTSHDLERLIGTVEKGAPSSFDLTALPLTGSRGALRYSVAPWTPIVALHQ